LLVKAMTVLQRKRVRLPEMETNPEVGGGKHVYRKREVLSETLRYT